MTDLGSGWGLEPPGVPCDPTVVFLLQAGQQKVHRLQLGPGNDFESLTKQFVNSI